MPLGISDHNKMVLWPEYEGRVEFSLHTKNVRSVRFVVKRRGCCCNLSGGVGLIVWFTTNGICVKNNTIMYVAWTSYNRVISSGDLYCCLLPRCEALCTCRSGFPIAAVASFLALGAALTYKEMHPFSKSKNKLPQPANREHWYSSTLNWARKKSSQHLLHCKHFTDYRRLLCMVYFTHPIVH